MNNENISYGYDELDRLTSASGLSESYVYNQIGNMTSRNGQSLTYGDTAHKHAATAYNGVSYVYDANGCMTTRGSQAIRYNPESMPVRVTAGGTICRFAYDGDNARRKRLDGNGTVHYVGPYERNVGNGLDTTETITKCYSASFGKLTRLIALRKGGTLYYVGSDHLGGTIRVADMNFGAVDGMRYKPYGESRDAGTNLKTDHKFTSQIEERARPTIRACWSAGGSLRTVRRSRPAAPRH